MGCGAYVAPTNPAWIATATTGAIADRLVAEANGGVGSARIRPGIIGEIGCSWPLEAVEGRVLVAAALAQARTGLAISVHPGRNRAAPLQIVERLAAAGADVSRVVIGHLDRTVQDLAGLVEIARSGPYVELDLFGLETSWYPWPGVAEGLSDAQRLYANRAFRALLLPWLAGLGVGGAGILARMQEHGPNCASRLTLWHNVLYLIADKPWTGWGWRRTR